MVHVRPVTVWTGHPARRVIPEEGEGGVDAVRREGEARGAVTTFRNPIGQLPDPWLIYHRGHYYLTGTTHEYIAVRRAASLRDLAGAQPTIVWSDTEPTRNAMMWAPELHLLAGPSRGVHAACLRGPWVTVERRPGSTGAGTHS